MAKEAKRRGRRSYLSDFSLDAQNQYVYTGTHYAMSASSPKSRKQALVILALWCGIAAAATVAGGCIAAPGMDNCVYLIVPYIAEVGAAFSLVWAWVRLAFAKSPVREYIYTATVKKFPIRALLLLIFAGIGAAGEGVFLLLHGFDGKIAGAVVFLLLKGCLIAAAIGVRREIAAEVWEESTRAE